MLMRLGVETAAYSASLRAAISAAVDSGASGVQIDVRTEMPPAQFGETARRQILHELAQNGLTLASVSFPLRHPMYKAAHMDARLTALRQAMDFAAQLKCRTLTTRCGGLPAEAAPEAGLLTDALEDLARHGNHVGVTVALTVATEEPARLAALLGSIRTGAIGVDLDPAGVLLAGRNPIAAFRALHQSVMHIQARDAQRDVDGAGRETQFGRGEVDWRELLALSAEAGYTGWFIARRTAGDDRAADVAQAVAYLKNLANV